MSILGSENVLVIEHEDTPTVVIRQEPEPKVVISSEGLQGPTGRGIVSVVKTGGTGAPGTYDTYTITYSDGSTSTFEIYNGADGDGASLAVHIADETPHPAYDDMISLVLQFENGLV